MPVRVKICGLTRPGDAEAAVEAGASYLGVVFAGGPRQISVPLASEISRAGGAIPVFGIFGDQTVEEILHTSDGARLKGAQLHGPYGREAASRLRREGLVVWRVVRIAAPADVDVLDSSVPDSDAVLVEPMVSHLSGGAGVALDLAVARAARLRLAGHPMVLAGGLDPATVAEAAVLVRPDVVDVSSGVESLPGIKDSAKIARFMGAVCGHSAVS
ncbi:MAG: phosphoribosylanthranilate isomerase [Gemmatimonadales bacterium]